MGKIKSRLVYLAITAMIITSLFVTTGCSKASTTTTSSAVQTTTTSAINTSQPAPNTVNANSKTGLGTYLTDNKGMTLYWTNRDAVGQSNITGTTLANWPVFYVATIVVPSSLNAGDFSSITRADGTKQTTFKGWPLYYYIKDIAPSDTLGQGLAGVWFVAVPTSSAPPSSTTTTTTTTMAMTTTTTTSVVTTTSTTAANTTTTSSTVTGTPVTISLTAQNVAFDKSTITVSAGAAVTINFNNKDSVPHNFALYTNSSATQPGIFVGQVVTGPTTVTYTFTAPTTPGTYFFRCDIHPSIMTGSFIVTAP